MRLLLSVYSFVNKLTLAVAALSAVAVVLASIAVSVSVVGRNVAGTSTVWELEASVFAVMFATFLAAAYTDTSGGQVAVDGLSHLLSRRLNILRRLLLDALTLALFAVILWSGWTMFLEAYELGWRSETIWGPPLWIPYLAVPLGALLVCLTLFLRIVIRACGGDVAPAPAVEH